MLKLTKDVETTLRTPGTEDGDFHHDVFDETMSMNSPSGFFEVDAYRSPEKKDLRGARQQVSIEFSDFVDPLLNLEEHCDVEDIILSLVSTYLYRTSGESEQSFALVADPSTAPVAGAPDASQGFVPFSAQVLPTASFRAVIDAVSANRAHVSTLRPVSFAALSPETTSDDGKAWSLPLPLVVAFRSDDDPGDPAVAEIELAIDTTQRRARLIFPAVVSSEFGKAVARHLCNLASDLAARPELPVGRHALISDAERKKMLVEWNDTSADYPYGGGFVERLERRAEADPDHPALVFKGQAIGYAEFNQRVNRLANHLRKSNVGSDTFVAICLDRSVEMVVAIWAILKAGGAYVPLNVEDPPQRLASIIRNAGARIILTEEQYAAKLPKTRTQIVLLSPESEAISRETSENPERKNNKNDLAYMIYTSGSTGEPKGVLVEHLAIWNRIEWMQDAYALTPEDRVLQKTPYTFDVSVWEFLWPLSVGSTLVIAEPGGHVVPSYLARLIRQENVSCAHFVPSVLRLFLTCPALDDLPLRMVFCSGEALSYELQQLFFSRLDSSLHNLYGPTEAAVDVTFWNCHKREHRGRVPIGKPISNIRMHILDECLQPIPVGAPGELYIGGIGLARGYWQKPELTAERFIDDPFEPGAKLYATGDVARYLPDGNIEYLGRNDHQVKINGARVELSEIESVIRLHPAVHDAAVITQKRDLGNAQLLAFLVPKAQGKGNAALDHLREFLEKRLPPHMIPRKLNQITRIPLTVSGKVDRRALSVLDTAA